MKKTIPALIAAIMAVSCLAPSALAVDYTFEAEDKSDVFYQSTAYEIVYGSEYNYSGTNVIDFADTAALLPGILSGSTQPASATATGAVLPSYDDPSTFYPVASGESFIVSAAYTSISELIRSDGSIGTVSIPSLSISMKVYEGTTTASMNKGLGHFTDSSGWNGNVSICGHNRGSKYNIGLIKNMKIGDIVEYTTILGIRKYAVTFVGTISSTDWSYVSSTPDNRITLITCLADQPSSRICVQAVEIK